MTMASEKRFGRNQCIEKAVPLSGVKMQFRTFTPGRSNRE